MKNVTLAKHARRTYAPDKIFAASQRAKKEIAELGEDAVINATLGECLDDEGKLMVLPTVERLMRQMPASEMCSYAPIAGIPGFNEAIQISLFGQRSDRFHVESVATPGGCGALRHAIWNFLDDGDAMLTTDLVWGPYKNICEEHNRRMKTFGMFDEQGAFALEAMDAAVGEVLAAQDQLLLILNTPANNPSGYTMTKEEMDGAVSILRRHALANPEENLTLCLDVSYIDFAGSFAESRRIFDSIQDMPENTMVLVIFSMSKSYTMCGMRCGALVCLGASQEAAEEFKKAMSYSSRSTWSNVVRMAQRVLVDICSDPALRQQVAAEREVFRRIIAARGRAFAETAAAVGLKTYPYRDGYFTAIPCRDPAGTAERLAERHVYVVPQAASIRFSPCAVTEEKCRRAPGIIREVLAEMDQEVNA